MVEPPIYDYVRPDLVDVQIVVHEGQKYFFGNINFVGADHLRRGSFARADS